MYRKTVLGTLVIRCPQLPFAADAYNQLRMTCSMVHSVRQSLEAEKAYVSAYHLQYWLTQRQLQFIG